MPYAWKSIYSKEFDALVFEIIEQDYELLYLNRNAVILKIVEKLSERGIGSKNLLARISRIVDREHYALVSEVEEMNFSLGEFLQKSKEKGNTVWIDRLHNFVKGTDRARRLSSVVLTEWVDLNLVKICFHQSADGKVSAYIEAVDHR